MPLLRQLIGSHRCSLLDSSVVDYIDWHLNIEPALHPWDKLLQVVAYYSFSILMSIFSCMSVRDIVLFLGPISVWFAYQGTAGLIQWGAKWFLLFHSLGPQVILKCIVQYPSTWRFSRYRYVTDFKFNFIVISKPTLHNLNYFKFVKVCLMVYVLADFLPAYSINYEENTVKISL